MDDKARQAETNRLIDDAIELARRNRIQRGLWPRSRRRIMIDMFRALDGGSKEDGGEDARLRKL